MTNRDPCMCLCPILLLLNIFFSTFFIHTSLACSLEGFYVEFVMLSNPFPPKSNLQHELLFTPFPNILIVSMVFSDFVRTSQHVIAFLLGVKKHTPKSLNLRKFVFKSTDTVPATPRLKSTSLGQ